MKRMKIELTNQEPTKCLLAGERLAKRPSIDEWRYGGSAADVKLLLERLQLGGVPDGLDSPIELLKYLEREGKMSPAVLKAFTGCPDVQILMLGPSYGGKINEVGLVEEGRHPVANCTVPLFHGYGELRVLDLTCVPICDEDCRYLIKLAKLQALGLSGTRVTGRGLRYLARHAQFVPTLQCIKLCYIDKLDDAGVAELAAFPNLAEVDLFGSNKITLSAVLSLVASDPRKGAIRRMRLPEKVHGFLRDRHVAYSQLGDLDTDPARIDFLTECEAKLQLRKHQRHYPDIFLNLSVASLHEKLRDIVTLRRKEEFVWSICQ